MKQPFSTIKYLILGAASTLFLANCTTYYDAQGTPVQAVDPVAATAGVVAVGAVAYAVAQNNSKRRGRVYHAPRYYRPYGY